jgi:glycosyltransferase involved in cell wall biosynthesis
LSFPASDLEVLIGNDDSEDRTALLVEEFIKDKPNFRQFHIRHTIGLARGKANVLAQLAMQAEGEYFFITDADIEVPPTGYRACLPGIGILLV